MATRHDLVRITATRLDHWVTRWPCSTLTTGYVVLDTRTGDLVDIGGRLAATDVDGHELDAFIDDYQTDTMRAIRGTRANCYTNVFP